MRTKERCSEDEPMGAHDPLPYMKEEREPRWESDPLSDPDYLRIDPVEGPMSDPQHCSSSGRTGHLDAGIG
jgi:hypothetical protein